jgi:rare lipoprotein A
MFRVRLGPLTSVSDADALLEKVIASGYPDARVVVD